MFKRKLEIEVTVKMANYDKLNADIATLSAKVDAQNTLIADLTAQLAAVPAPVPAVDEQPQVDAADQAVEAVIAKLP
jgi:hypothetical protein